MKLRCLILDDELPGLTYLRLLCEQIPNVEVVKVFNDPIKFIDQSKNIAFDFCILDIEMPQLNGLEVAQLLGNKPVIFSTAYKDYAADAFDLSAIDYIRKPIQLDRLKKAVTRVEKAIGDNTARKDFFHANTNKGRAVLFFDQILHITTAEKDKRDKLLRLEGNEILTLKNISLDQLMELLPEEKFSKVNKKDIIALKIVKYFAHSEIVTTLISSTGQNILLSLGESFKDDFVRKVSDK